MEEELEPKDEDAKSADITEDVEIIEEFSKEDDGEEVKTTSGTRISPKAWMEIRIKYESGDFTLKELAEEYDISISSASQHMRRRGIKKGSAIKKLEEKIREKTAEKVAEESVNFASRKAVRIEETKNDHYESAKMIAKLVNMHIIDSVKSKKDIALKYPDFKSLKMAAAALETARKERFAVLDIDNVIDESELPEILFGDLSEEDIEALQKSSPEDEFENITSDSEDISEIVETE